MHELLRSASSTWSVNHASKINKIRCMEQRLGKSNANRQLYFKLILVSIINRYQSHKVKLINNSANLPLTLRSTKLKNTFMTSMSKKDLLTKKCKMIPSLILNLASLPLKLKLLRSRLLKILPRLRKFKFLLRKKKLLKRQPQIC